MPEDISAIHLYLVLWKASRALEQHSDRSIARFAMGRSEFGVLEALLHRGPLAISELGAKVLLTSGSMTAAIDRLETRGLVERQATVQDRRARLIHLTPAGRALIEQAFIQHCEAMEQAVSGFSAEERSELLPLLRRLGRTAESHLQTTKPHVAPASAGKSQS